MGIPDGVSQEAFMRMLTNGHDYYWVVLARTPVLVAHGESARPGMYEILLVNRQVVLGTSDKVFESRLQRLLEVMSRTHVKGSGRDA